MPNLFGHIIIVLLGSINCYIAGRFIKFFNVIHKDSLSTLVISILNFAVFAVMIIICCILNGLVCLFGMALLHVPDSDLNSLIKELFIIPPFLLLLGICNQRLALKSSPYISRREKITLESFIQDKLLISALTCLISGIILLLKSNPLHFLHTPLFVASFILSLIVAYKRNMGIGLTILTLSLIIPIASNSTKNSSACRDNVGCGNNTYYSHQYSPRYGTWKSRIGNFNFQGNGGSSIINNGQIQLTQALPDQEGTAFVENPMALNNHFHFNASFAFQLFGGTGADGISFMLQNSNKKESALGNHLTGGGGVGTSGIKPSLAIAFRTYTNNSIDVWNNGVNSGKKLASITPVFSLRNKMIYCWVDYSNNNDLSIYVSDVDNKPNVPILVTKVNIRSILGNKMYIGFTGGTGASTDNQIITKFNFYSQ